MAFAAILASVVGFRPAATVVAAARYRSRASTMMVGVEDLKSDLLSVLSTVPERGTANWQAAYDARPPPYVQQVLDLCNDLEPYDPAEYEGGWMQSSSLGGWWRLVYTSSGTFRRNQGLSGYAGLLEGVETPQLLMQVDSDPLLATAGTVTYFEELTAGAEFVGRYVRCPDGEVPEQITISCTWAIGTGDMMKITAKTISVGSRSWEVIDRRDSDEVDVCLAAASNPR